MNNVLPYKAFASSIVLIFCSLSQIINHRTQITNCQKRKSPTLNVTDDSVIKNLPVESHDPSILPQYKRFIKIIFSGY